MAGGIKIKCKTCGDIIQSMYRHDFVSCTCGNIFIDGGSDYTRMGYPAGGEAKDYLEEIKEGE
jgi:hypothetical protein